jgi:molybdopterin synthase catalytic subunit
MQPSDRIVLCRVHADPIDPEAVRRLVASHRAGAVVLFSGDVREHDGGRAVASLAYEAHPSADAVLRTLVDEAAATDGVVAIAAAHRVGEVPIGESALVVAVASEHREAAFSICTALVERVKAELPIWKHQRFSDGTEEWVNCL